ncbi:MAG TPA: hypothetical protein PLI66_08415 [Spirochaetales bacterium]|nr:hypothetical protein [Spirochaetales bacterium]
MKSQGNEPYLGIVSPLPSPLEQYEDQELRAEFRLALRRARLRSTLGAIIDGFCGLYERLGLGRPRVRPAPDAPATTPPATIGIDQVAGTIAPDGRLVAGPPRLSRRDYAAWAVAYAAVREHGPSPIHGRYVDGGFYLDTGRSLAVRVEAARALGYEALQTADPSSRRDPAIMAS